MPLAPHPDAAPPAPPSAPALPELRPSLQFDPTVLLRAQGVRVVFFDIDGVLTDGGLYFSDAGETLKRFNSLDGHGIKLLQRAGIAVAVVSGRDSAPLRTRLQALGVTHTRLGCETKRPAAQELLHALGLGWHEAAAMGDDWPDLPLLRRCALAVAPPQAHPEVRRVAHHTTLAAGGHGAARELCDLLLVASGHYARLLQEAGA
ncbi:MAG: HAD hydrolase family protein [Pseudomonadota bacterium]|jgi:3-deoxy-D-manno-octulosonate 8-phosphate phosphatase (KDO 8-P phosphatase)